MRWIGGVTGIAILASASAQAQAPQQERGRTAFAAHGQKGAGWFICDAVDARVIALVGRPDTRGGLAIGLIRKTVPASTPAVTRYVVGRADPGAGQIYWPISRGGREVGNVHAFNAGAYGDEQAVRTPPFVAARIGAIDLECRWLANTRLMGIAARRSFVVREAAGQLVYESFDYAGRNLPIERPDGAQQTNRPTQRVTGGRESRDADGTTRYRFANEDYAYAITVPPRGAATIAVERGGRTMQREPLLAYTIARR